jgi:hypothetical protein
MERRKEANELFAGLIFETIPRMENAQIIDILNITLLEAQGCAMLFR